jgi:vacuolar-type H+-ATPase subunit H
MTDTLLETVADHEVSLMQQLAEAKKEASRGIEEAHTAAATHLLSVQQTLESESAARRKDAALARERDRAAIQAETARHVAELRSTVADKAGQVRDEIIGMLLPQSGA